MAAYASRVSLLLFGIFLWGGLSTFARAEVPQEAVNIENLPLSLGETSKDDADHELQTRGLFDSFGVSGLRDTIFGKTGSGTQDIAKDTGDSSNSGGWGWGLGWSIMNPFGSSGTQNNNVPNDNVPINEFWTDKAIQFNANGLTMRCLNVENKEISVTNNKILVDDNSVCDDINKLERKSSYQKSADGTLWYTNAKVGEPMSKAEIKQFEVDWAQYKKEQQQHTEAVKKRLKLEAEDRERRFKELQAASEKQYASPGWHW